MRITIPTITFESGAGIALVNGEWVPYFAGGQGAFGYGQSKQDSKSYSGLRGTPQFGEYAKQYAGVGNNLARTTNEYAASPVNTFQGQTGQRLTDTNPNTGLPMSFNNVLGSVGNTMFANASAGGAMRGQISPESTTGVVGSALQNTGQYLAPYIVDWQKYMLQFPEEMKKSRLGMYQNTLGAMSPGLGGQTQAQGNAFHFSASGGATGGGQATNMGTCWIAGVLYGEGSTEQHLIRTWLGTKVQGVWYQIRKLYSKYGEQTAQYAQKHTWVQAVLRPVFNYMLKQARG